MIIREDNIQADLERNWAVVSEAIQTILRKNGETDAYERLKELTRGISVNKESLFEFVSGLKIPDDDKHTLIQLSPKSYIGLASKLVEKL